VDFVNNIDLVSCNSRHIHDGFPDLANIIHAVVGRGVYLDYIYYGPVKDSPAYIASVARIAVDGSQTVDSTGQYFGHGGFPCASGSAEKIGVVNGIVPDAVFEGFNNMALFNNVIKGKRSPFSIQCQMRHGFTIAPILDAAVPTIITQEQPGDVKTRDQ